jgi:nucleotide-binding universal stress UspA family protein
MNSTISSQRLRVLLPMLPDESVDDAARLLRSLFDPSRVCARRVFVQRPLRQEVFLSPDFTGSADLARIELDAENATRVQCEKDMAALAAAGFEISADVLGGSPRAEVLRDAALWPADLVAVRAHRGSGGEDRLGQMASALLHHAPCPVLLYHHVPEGYAPKRLLLPVDFSGASRRAAEWGLALAAIHGARADLLHVVDARGAGGRIAPDKLVRMAREEIAAWQARAASLAVASDVSIADTPADGILGYAGHREHDLIVLAAAGASEVAAMLLGSTVRRVVRGTSVPVLVLPTTNRVVLEDFAARAGLHAMSA